MKILMLHPHDIFSPSEPWTIRIVSLAREFRDMGHEVKLAYCPLEIDERKRDIDLDHIEVIILSRKTGLKNLFSNIAKIKRYSLWAEIIHFQKCFHYVSLPALWAGWLLHKPVHYDWDDWEEMIWYHSNRPSVHTAIFGLFLKVLERFIPRLAGTVSVSSRKLADLCLAFGRSPADILKAHVGADLRRFSPSVSGGAIRQKYGAQDRKIVLYIGQLHGGQYVKMFIEAASLITASFPEALFFVVGQGYMLKELQMLALVSGIRDKVVFTGSIPYDLVPQYVGAADICVAPFENNEVTVCKSPLKIVEYLASGKPIVASLVGETRNMVGGAGLLVEPGNHRALAEAVALLLKDPLLRGKMGILARRRAEARYNWTVTAKKLIVMYERTLGRAG